MEALFSNVLNLQWQQVVMWGIGGAADLPGHRQGYGAHPAAAAWALAPSWSTCPSRARSTQVINGVTEHGALSVLFDAGIANELFPLLLFIGIGAMIDFGPLLSNPKLMIFGAAAQFGIFFTLCAASMFFDINDAASIAIIGAADGPTAIVVAQKLGSKYLGAIMVAAYSYMALVPVIQPPVIRLLTTKKERMIRMPYHAA